MSGVQSHPAYADGFWDAMDGEPLFPDAAPEYEAGWRAAHLSREIIKSAGLQETAPGQFTATATLKGPSHV